MPALGADTFDDQFVRLFEAYFARIYRYLDRLSGDPELASDLAQETFIRLYRRGTMPATPEAWLITVALNLFRNARTTANRRKRLLTTLRGQRSHSDPLPWPGSSVEAAESRQRVRAALDRLPERERSLLLLQAEGFDYQEIAAALRLNHASLGTMLIRARTAFRAAYEETSDAR